MLLSSHILSEVEALCDRVTIIRGGRAAESGTFDELRHLTRTTVVVETARSLAGLRDLDGVHDLGLEPHGARFSVDPGELNRVLRASGRLRRPHADQLAAHARGAVPAALRRRRPCPDAEVEAAPGR